jgi:hypothetical protein
MALRTEYHWRAERKTGIAVIALSVAVNLALWFVLRRLIPPLVGMQALEARMLVALKCVVMATLYCFVTGIEAVAHERLQGAAFDPLAGHETTRLRINSRYLQNTLEQLITFAVGLFGLAAYLTSGDSMRLLPAVTTIWIVNRFAFWVGYHRSAAMRGLGAPSMAIGLIMLVYVAYRIGGDIAGTGGAAAAVAAYLFIEAVLFWKTRQ